MRKESVTQPRRTRTHIQNCNIDSFIDAFVTLQISSKDSFLFVCKPSFNNGDPPQGRQVRSRIGWKNFIKVNRLKLL